MAKGYSARGGFSGGGSAMRQQQMQQKLLKMQQDMAAAQEAVENASFTASVGGGVVQATVSGKKELTALTVKPEAVDPEDVEMLQDLVISAVNEALRQADEAMNSSMQSFTGGLNQRSSGQTRRSACLPAAFAMENASIGRFCHCQHGFWRFHRQCAFRHVLLSPVCFSARFVIASVLFGTFCYRQRTFSARFVMAGTYFRCSLSSSIWLFDVVCDFRNIISCAFCRSCGFLALLLSSS